MKTFEEFLEEKYDEINNNSNNMNPEFESARDRWFENLDVQELIDYGEEYGKKIYYEGQCDGLDRGKRIMTEVFGK